jgi:hypothetical protein
MGGWKDFFVVHKILFPYINKEVAERQPWEKFENYDFFKYYIYMKIYICNPKFNYATEFTSSTERFT